MPSTAAPPPPPTSCKTILAGTIAKHLLSEVQQGLESFRQANGGRVPTLVGLLANDDPAAQMYAEWTEKTCREK